MPRRKPPKATVNRVVTFTPNGRYGFVSCSWEDEPRKTQITEAAAIKVAEGWDAEYVRKQTKAEW